MEQKTLTFEVKELDEETGVFEAYGATFSDVPDAYGDVIDAGAFKKTIKEGKGRIKVLWNHNVNEPIGKPMELREDEHGLYIKAKLSLGVQRAREVLALMKDGIVTEMSIGYETVRETVKQGIRHLQEIRLYDVSPVSFAANPEALVTSVKAHPEKIQAAIEALQALLEPAGTEPEKSTPATTETPEAELEAALTQLEAIATGFDAMEAEARIDAIMANLDKE